MTTRFVRLLVVVWTTTTLPNCSTFAPRPPPSSSLFSWTSPSSFRARDASASRLSRVRHDTSVHLKNRRSRTTWLASAGGRLDDGDGDGDGPDGSAFAESASPSSAVGTSMKGGDDRNVGGYNPTRDKLPLQRESANVGNPQTSTAQPERMNIEKVLTELQAIQSQGPKKYCLLGTRHCSYLHQQIVEMLAYAIVLSGNHLYTSGAAGTNAAAIRGALRAMQPHLLTVVLPQSMSEQTLESQELLRDVANVVTMPQNDDMPLDLASRICNSHLLNQTDHLVSFAFHESHTVIEAAKEAMELDMLVTLLYLD